ncbi:MAG: DUF4292 domain-containing protein [Ignavibacteriaceae bacterium]|nr:DUF4292 domain-containing protein [Ignavibacteriaceae bacterium]
MKYPRLLILLILAVMAAGLAGCAASSGEDDDYNANELLPAERLVKKLEANRRKVKNFEGRGTLDIKTPEFSNGARFAGLLVKPDSMNIEILGPFGITLGNILVTSKDFKFYEGLNNILYTGTLEQDILRSMFRLDLTLDELNDAFIGAVNLTERLYKNPDEYKVDRDKYVITYVDSAAGKKYIYKIDISNLGITDYTVRDLKNIPLIEGKYSDFTLLDGIPIPKKIEISNKSKDQMVKINYNEFKINKKDAFIRFTVPSDAQIIEY